MVLFMYFFLHYFSSTLNWISWLLFKTFFFAWKGKEIHVRHTSFKTNFYQINVIRSNVTFVILHIFSFLHWSLKEIYLLIKFIFQTILMVSRVTTTITNTTCSCTTNVLFNAKGIQSMLFHLECGSREMWMKITLVRINVADSSHNSFM